jgi:hypothetical protein
VTGKKKRHSKKRMRAASAICIAFLSFFILMDAQSPIQAQCTELAALRAENAETVEFRARVIKSRNLVGDLFTQQERVQVLTDLPEDSVYLVLPDVWTLMYPKIDTERINSFVQTHESIEILAFWIQWIRDEQVIHGDVVFNNLVEAAECIVNRAENRIKKNPRLLGLVNAVHAFRAMTSWLQLKCNFSWNKIYENLRWQRASPIVLPPPMKVSELFELPESQ